MVSLRTILAEEELGGVIPVIHNFYFEHEHGARFRIISHTTLE